MTWSNAAKYLNHLLVWAQPVVLRIWLPTYGQLGASTIPAFPCPPQPAHVHPAWSDTVGSFSPHTLGQSSTAAGHRGGHCGWTTRPWLQQKVHVEWVMSRETIWSSYTFIFVTSRAHVRIRRTFLGGYLFHYLGRAWPTWGTRTGQASRLGRSSVEAADPNNLAKL